MEIHKEVKCAVRGYGDEYCHKERSVVVYELPYSDFLKTIEEIVNDGGFRSARISVRFSDLSVVELHGDKSGGTPIRIKAKFEYL